MQRVNLSRTRRVVNLALGYDLEANRQPSFCFDLPFELAALGASPIEDQERPGVGLQALDAYDWCAARFPLGIQSPEGFATCAIAELCLARSANAREYLTASSPHRPRSIFVAAPWPLPSVHRLGSLIAHEAMHQALYLRERAETVVRAQSLAYSPWKQRLRPGRLVWHAFWTFSAQFVLLAEALIAEEGVMLDADAGLLDFMAEMDARLGYCVASLDQFDVLTPDETLRMQTAFVEVRQANSDLSSGLPAYARSLAGWTHHAALEIEQWSKSDLMGASAG